MALSEAQKRLAAKNRKYWADREREQAAHNITDEKEYDAEVRRILESAMDGVQKELEAFYGRYAKKNGITIAEAKKRVAKADISEWERKAAKYVKEKDFSAQANEEMAQYNATMRLNRLEMLKAHLGLETIAGFDELDKFMQGVLRGRSEEELVRQAGILGKTVKNPAKYAEAIVNGSFHNATFSDRIWMYQDALRVDIGKLVTSGLIQGKNPRVLAREIRKTFDTTRYNAERLMRTELRRVQTEAQKQSFKRNGFELYIFICNVNPTKHNTCEICKYTADHDSGFGKGVYKVEDMMPGTNAPPMHPHCRCSTAAYSDDAEYQAWLDHIEKGGTTESWNSLAKPVKDAKIKAKKGPLLDIQFFSKSSKDYPTIYLEKQEYAHVMSEFATHMTAAERKRKVVSRPIGNYIYTIENNGFGDYRVIGKEPIDKDFSAWWED